MPLSGGGGDAMDDLFDYAATPHLVGLFEAMSGRGTSVDMFGRV